MHQIRTDLSQLNIPIRIIDALNQVTELLYSGAGCASCGAGVDKLVGVKDAKLHQTDFTYYTTGELKSEIAPGDPATRRLLYKYYPGGQLKEKRRDADGDGEVGSGDQVILSFTYNPDGKLAGKTDHLTGETTTFSYYPLGQAHAGLLQSAASPAVTYTFDYFDNGWLKNVTDNSGRVIRYDAYDALGRRELMTLLPGTAEEKVLDYVYDGQKQLEQIVSAAGTFTFGYDDWQRRGSLTYPNGVVASYGYNGQTDWLTGITYKEGETGPVLLGIAYPEHDKVGNRKQRTEDNVATTYAYDDVYQLRQAKTGASEENFVYDAVGNRKSGPTVKDTEAAAYEHDDANRMTKGRKFDYAYDDFGNQQFRYLNTAHTKYWEYTWNGENRLVEAELVKNAAVLRTVTFKYDPFGRRIEKKVVEGSTTTTYTYVYDAEDIALEYKTVQVGAGSPATASTQYVHGPGIDEPLAMVRNGQSYFYHADGLGSIVAITDNQQDIVQRYAYESFGMVTAMNPEFENTYTYTGREWDKETGLLYVRNRYLDLMEGRFISKDPIGFAGGDVNVFRYVFNDPVRWVDPTGLDVTITINRTTYTSNSIVGTISVTSTATSSTFTGNSLENRTPPNQNLPVPPGTYSASVRTDHTPNRIELADVPNASNVQIHTGNSASDVIGCFAVGTSTSTDWVGGSVDAMNGINNIVSADGSGNITVSIIGNAARP